MVPILKTPPRGQAPSESLLPSEKENNRSEDNLGTVEQTGQGLLPALDFSTLGPFLTP